MLSHHQRFGRAALAVSFATLLASACLPGCSGEDEDDCGPVSSSTIFERLTNRSVDKVDLLVVLDNSRGMADKHAVLSQSVPYLLDQLINPQCIDDDGIPVAPSLQPDPLGNCPAGTQRRHEPIFDVHIGVITSSLGGHGADACSGITNPSENDNGQLITRSSTDGSTPPVPSWQNQGFLVWDPVTENPTHQPQGQTDPAQLSGDLQAMIGGAGQIGCGFEATLEAWYRFLVEPDPHQSISVQNGLAVTEGTDTVLLEQRAAFLRPDSLLSIVMLSDENDCSMRDGADGYLAAQIYAPGGNTPFHLPKPRAACATDPNSDCCRSCADEPGDGCDTSADDCNSGPLSNLDDHVNLRCFDQKRRFGVDYLYPIERYVAGLTQAQIADRHGNVQPNPLFDDLNPADGNSIIRDSGLVFLTGIVGVPWQDIARRNDSGQPDLLAGLSVTGQPKGGFQAGFELIANGTWDVILGDPANNIAPADPLMRESVDPRSGTNPITGDAIQPPGSGELANPINGHEYTNDLRGDLQYACIFPLQTEHDCGPGSTEPFCDCSDPGNDKPLCVSNPADNGNPTLQRYAKAYPGVRQLQVLQAIGSQGIVGSICPAQQTDPALLDFGYHPVMSAASERLSSAVGGQCFPRTLNTNNMGQVDCAVLEARNAPQCNCDIPGRSPVEADDPMVEVALEDPLAAEAGWNCFCRIEQASGEDLAPCQGDTADNPVNASGEGVHRWCYIDATVAPAIGNPELVEACPSTEKRILRFTGQAKALNGATLFIACASGNGVTCP